ncbi:MAG: enoyl-CoA hydratase/isomerase family protein [Desulfobacterales bacterium]|jgi:enoyl-CoA hydratase/carnithine racemase|nr:enoyl-CoA hydratase/isomerase family protein [Desulfobacterales bacterium]
MALVEYALDENVAIVTLNNGENRFNPDFIRAYLDVMDKIENETQALTLVVRSSHDKIFTNGLDLDWLLPVIQKKDVKAAKDFFYFLNELFKRTLMSPMLTVAAINGHAFAGGAIYSCAFDFRFMRSDRGFFCVPEVDLGIPFLPGMLALLNRAIPRQKFEELQFTGKRLTAGQCAENNIVTKACHINDLMNETLAFAKSLNKRRAVILEMKKRMHGNILHALNVEDVPYIESGTFNI